MPERPQPPPVPNGWYAICASSDLRPGEVISTVAVDRHLVAYREEGGAAHVLDAHCPHLGAHLGAGRVVGSGLKCRYHGWEFGPDGTCAHIPYGNAHIPSRACVRSYTVDEKDGFVYFWYHALDTPPEYEVPHCPEIGRPGWSAPYEWRAETEACLQEMGQNNVDVAHFRYVHHAPDTLSDLTEFSTDGPFSTVRQRMPGTDEEFTRWTYGPGVAYLLFPGLASVLAASTPVDRHNVRLLWHFHFPEATESAAAQIMDMVTGTYGFQADVPIWRDMAYQERPVLVKGDGPIAEYRRWYARFYEGAERSEERAEGDSRT